jgi:8-oxo-dGTP pyrophosphatase MutT (NUDIX family)
VTCSALVVNDEGRMLRIWHNSFGKWLQPGGHLEPSDTSLVGAALRELAEETGIALDPAALLDNQPIDVDVHAIPANRTRGEPKHQHFDLRRSSAELAVPRDRGRVGEARDLVDDDA